MTAQLRSELLKQRSTRTNLLLLGWIAGLVVLVVALHVLSFSTSSLADADNQVKILGLGTSIGALFAALLGAMSITGEFRSGTIRPTLLVTPRRTRVIAAKALAALAAGVAIGLLAEVLAAGAEAIGLAARGVHIEPAAGDYAQLLAGGALGGALFAAIGVGIGAMVRNQVAALIGLCVWLLFIEPLLLADVPSVARYAPESAAGAVAGAIQSQIADSLTAPALGVLLLVAYAALSVCAGALLVTRRDVD
jgi:ABC-type transport system involved in multi-copper enzyme maturation permease subunit